MPFALEPVILGHKKKISEDDDLQRQLSQVSNKQHICVPRIFQYVNIYIFWHLRNG